MTTTKEIFQAFLQLAEEILPEAQNVPEPPTATLSLLALAGLAARRRK